MQRLFITYYCEFFNGIIMLLAVFDVDSDITQTASLNFTKFWQLVYCFGMQIARFKCAVHAYILSYFPKVKVHDTTCACLGITIICYHNWFLELMLLVSIPRRRRGRYCIVPSDVVQAHLRYGSVTVLKHSCANCNNIYRITLKNTTIVARIHVQYSQETETSRLIITNTVNKSEKLHYTLWHSYSLWLIFLWAWLQDSIDMPSYVLKSVSTRVVDPSLFNVPPMSARWFLALWGIPQASWSPWLLREVW